MIFTVSQENIDSIISSTFPTVEYFNFNSVILDNYGPSATSVKLSFILQDDIQSLKVFNNLTAKKMMFLKIFEINSQQMRDQISTIKNIKDLNKILQQNNVYYKDLNAALSFIGDTKDVYQHFTQDKRVFLNYSFNFTLPKKDPQYLSFGAVFYYDTDIYSEENKLPKEYINYETIFGPVKTTNIIDNFLPNSPVLKDLRILKDIFTVEKLYQQISFKTTGPKLLSSKTKKTPYNQYFSNLYISKKSENTAGLLFNIDYHKLIFENSPVKDIIFRSQDVNTLLNKSYISNVTIKKRLVKKHNKSFIDLTEQPENLISTSDGDNLLLVNNNNDNGGIEEVVLDTSSTLKLRTVAAEDKKVYSNKKGSYQYGVEIKVVDGIIEYLKNISKLLSDDNNMIVKYLSETDKTVTTSRMLYEANPHSKASNSAMSGFYDPLAGKFTPYFMYVYFPRNYSDSLLTAISRFMSVLDLFGFVKKDIEKVRSVLISFINPAFATAQTIQYFANSHSRLINQINKILNESYNNNYSLEHWFENDVLEVDNKSQYGYRFINIQNDSIFGKIDSDYINLRTEEEILKYSSKSDISGSQLSSKFSYVSPIEISLENNTFDLEQLKVEKNFYPLEDYKNIELEIKRYNLLKEKDKQVITSNKITAISQNQQKEILKNNRLFSDESVSIQIIDSLASDISGSEYKLKTDIDPTMLYLGLAKYPDKQNNVASSSLQAELLIEGNGRYFDNTNKENIFLKDLDLNSKYNILYNTIHKIDFLSYDQNLKKEIWTTFDQKSYLDMESKKTILCRITPTNIDAYSNISLPIHNKYFLLTYKQETPVSFRTPDDEIVNPIRPSFVFPKPPPIIDQPPLPSIPEPATLELGPIFVTSFVAAEPPAISLPIEPPADPPPVLPVDGNYKLDSDKFNTDINGWELAPDTRYSINDRQNIIFGPSISKKIIILKSRTKIGNDSRYMFIAQHVDPNRKLYRNKKNRLYIIDRLQDKILWELGAGDGTLNNVWELDDNLDNTGPEFITIRDGQLQIFTRGTDSSSYKVLITAGIQYSDPSIASTAYLILQDDGNLSLYVAGNQVWATNTYDGRYSKSPKNYGGGSGNDINVIKGVK